MSEPAVGPLATGFVLGLAFCAAPGAVTAEAIRRGAARGWPAALALGAGSLLGDALWAAAGLAGAASLARGGLARALGAAGVGLLLYLAWQALQEARRQPRSPSRVRAGADVLAGAALSLTNPLAVGFWLTAGGAVAAQAPGGSAALPWVFAGVMAAAGVWCVALSAAVSWARRWMTGPALRVLSVLSALLLLGAGVRLALGLLG